MLRRWLNDRPEIVSHDIVTRAMHGTGTDQFDGVVWTEPLEVLTRSLDRDAHLTLGGRRRARNELVDLLASRSAERPDDTTVPTLFVLGLEGSGATDLAARLGASDVVTRVVESTFASLTFEERWHLPSYAEWLADADLGEVYRDVARRFAGGIVTGAGHLEQLPAIRSAFPEAIIVHVDHHPDECLSALVERVVAARRRDSDDVDPDKVERYWRWRVGLLLERNRAQRATVAGPTIDVTHAELSADPDGIADRVRTSLG